MAARTAITIAALFVFSFSFCSPASAQSATTQKEAALKHVLGSFDVSMTRQDDNKSVDGVSRMLIEKQYHGDLEGTAKGQMLTSGISANNSGAYVAIEKFSGTLHGRSGSFALYHTGEMRRGTPGLTVEVAPDSATGEFAGLQGKMTIRIAADGKHSYDFEYTEAK